MSRPDGYWIRQIDPWPRMSSIMMDVLAYLRRAKAEGWVFVQVDNVADRKSVV